MLSRWVAAALMGSLAVRGTALAANWPTRPVTMIVPFAAGGPTDVVGRILAGRMSEILKQNIVVVNVGGAGGKGKGAIYRAGELVGTYAEAELLGMLRLEIEKVIAEKYPAYLHEIGSSA